MNMIRKMLLILMLLFPAISDIKNRSFNITTPVLLFVIALSLKISLVFSGDDIGAGLAGIVMGILPGLFLAALSVLSRAAVGEGDALIVILLGAIMGPVDVIILCIVSLVMCGITGLALITVRGGDRKTALPFLPFVLISYILMCLL